MSAIDVFKKHVPMVVGLVDIAHSANIGVLNQAHDGSFSSSADLFGMICPISFGSGFVLIGGLARDDFDGDLENQRDED